MQSHGHRPPDPNTATVSFTTLPGRMIGLEIALRELGRRIELRPGDWPMARAAFQAASEVRALRSELFR